MRTHRCWSGAEMSSPPGALEKNLVDPHIDAIANL
jgi:hypothetical protein